MPKEGHFCAKVRALLRPGKSTFVPPINDKGVQVRHDPYLRNTDSYLSEIRVVNKSFVLGYKRYWFLENLLPNCKVLNINTPKKQKVPKETNWKQKFQKPQNENICLTYLNTEMNGNFHFLSFCAAFLKVQNQVLWTLLSFQQSGWKNGFSWKNVHEKWAFQVAFYSIFCENTVVCLTFYV